jgi:hypothetical protein
MVVRRLWKRLNPGTFRRVPLGFNNLRTTMRVACLGLALMAASGQALAARTDVVSLVNGDSVTGEVKELTQGLLRYKTDSMSTVSVEWVDVVRVVSKLTFQVEAKNGEYYYGAFLEPDEDRVLRVGIGEFQVDLKMTEVVGITRIKHGFWKTVDGSLSLGFQATKATEVVQMSFMGNAERRTRTYLSDVHLRLAVSSTSEQPTTKNNSVGFSQDWFLGHHYAAGGSLQFQQNDELGIDLRTLVGANATRALVQALRQRLNVSVGLSFNRENVTDGDETNSMEAMVNLDWSIYKYKSPKTTFYFKWFIYPSLTESGRIRSQLDTSLRQELVKDFFLDFSGIYSYDSDPPNEEASSDDYSITAGLGWSF